MKPRYQALAAFALTAMIGIALRTRDCFFVDGAPRCLPVFQHATLQFHPNNHLLYLVDVLFWTRMVAALGFKLADPLAFVLAVDAMNVLAAAVGMGIFYWVILRVTSSWKLTTVVCAGYGFTVAFLAQATNPNEPMAGACWSFLAIGFAILSLGRHKYWPVAMSGVLFALAMATYRSMVFFAPAAALIVVSSASKERLPRTQQVAKLAVLGIAFALGCTAIFGWAYTHMGVSRADMFSKFLHQDDTRAYFDPSPVQFLKLPLGLVRNCFPVVPFYNGMRGFLHGPKSTLLSGTMLVIALWSCLFYCGYALLKRRASLSEVERIAVFASLTGLLFTMVPLLSWNPHYGKFWIQPLACLAVLVAIAFGHFAEMSQRVLAASRIAGAIFLLGVACNLTWALRNRSHNAFEFEEARKVTQFIGDKDFVILDRGSDSVSVMYAYLWADEKQLFPIVDRAAIDGKGMLNKLDAEIRKTRAAGGTVYFLGVVDLPKPTWDAFLDRRCGVPYETFDRYRAAVRLKTQFNSRTGPASLWELQLTPPPADRAAREPQAHVGAEGSSIKD